MVPLKSSAVSRLRSLLGLDRAPVVTVLARGWSSLAGLVTILLIAHFLTGAEQGYYYTFGSLVALHMVISNALMSISIAWVNTKAAPFGAMIARKEYVKLDQAFFRALTQSLFVCVSGAAAVWGAVTYLYAVHNRFAHRVLSPLPFAMLLLAMILNHI